MTLAAASTCQPCDSFDVYTRVVFRVTDEFGAIRPYSNDPIVLSLEGPAEIVGDNPFALVGDTEPCGFAQKKKQGRPGSPLSILALGSQTISLVSHGVPTERI